METLRTRFPRYSTLEIVIMIVIAAVAGIVALVVDAGDVIAQGLGTIALQMYAVVIYGALLVFALIAARIIRKPGAAFVTKMLSGIVGVLLGDPLGLWLLGYAFIEGIGLEVGLAVFRYQRWDWVALWLAAALAVLFEQPLAYITFGWGEMPVWSWLPLSLLPLLTVLPWVWVLAVGVPNLLERKGLIKQGAVGR